MGVDARRHPHSRSSALAVTMLLALTACGSEPSTSGADDAPDSGAAATVELDQTPGDPAEDVPSALDDMTHADFPEPLVDPDEIISGGPPPDGIPAIDEPRFQRVGDVDWLDDAEAVLSVTIGGETRGYPVQVLM